jgi:hypothetical protein
MVKLVWRVKFRRFRGHSRDAQVLEDGVAVDGDGDDAAAVQEVGERG